MTNDLEPYVVTSPLKAWDGDFSLPHPDDFRRPHWETWKRETNKPKRKPYAMIHLYGYAGLVLIKQYGDWNMSIPLVDVQSWEDNPDAEHVKLMAFIGREMLQYMNGIMDPKD